MSTIETTPGINTLAARYDAVICDVWGVLHDGVAAFPDAVACLGELQRAKMPVIVVSNAPRPSSEIIKQLADLGVDRTLYVGIVTSGDVTRLALIRKKGHFLHLGPERDRPLLNGFTFTALESSGAALAEDLDYILCTGVLDDDHDTVEDYRDLLTRSRERGLEMLCANPDLVVVRSGKRIPCAGVLAALYRELGGEVSYFGKPYKIIFDHCLRLLADLTAPVTDQSRVLVVGDGLATDIAGAKKAGMGSALVCGGIEAEALGISPGQLPSADKLESLCAGRGIYPDATLATFQW